MTEELTKYKPVNYKLRKESSILKPIYDSDTNLSELKFS